MESEWLPNSENLALLKDGVLIGFSSLVNDRLAAIFIHPNEQGMGYGTVLLNETKKLRKKLELNVFDENESAVKFYEAHGFLKRNHQKDPNSGHFEYVMTWNSKD